MLKAWEISNHRATLDIDLLGKTKNSIQNLKEIINDISKSEVVADGIHYETTSLKLTEMQVNGEYHGLRALLMQICTQQKFLCNLILGLVM